jgi:thioester reductase-like protein
MGLAPHWGNQLNCMPVDLVSQSIVTASLTFSCANTVFNIVNRNRLPWLKLIEWLNRYGYKIEVISDEEWCEQHLPLLKSDNALFPLVGLYSNGSGVTEDPHTAPLSQKEAEQYVDQNGAHLFDLLGRSPPVIDTDVLRIYFHYLHQCGYIHKPTGEVQ